MKLIALPDLPGDIQRLDGLADHLSVADVVLLVGDITNAGGASGAAKVVDAVRRYNPSILAIPGNWDDLDVSTYLTREKINLHRRHVIIDQIAFAGAGGSLPAPVRTPNEVTETELQSNLAAAVAGLNEQVPIILVCHQPPIRTLNDQLDEQTHVGSEAVRAFIEATQPLACFTGHIHEGVGIDTIGRTKIVNPGPLSNGGYAYAEITRQGIWVECRQL